MEKELIEKTEKRIPKLQLDSRLFGFQKIGVQEIEKRNGRILIADEMGLGKTVQALGWLYAHPEKKPVLIVTPASVKYNWRNEALKWQDNKSIQILSGREPYEISEEIVIINYDILKDWINVLIDIPFEILIGDEIHYIKNNKAERTVAFKKLARVIPHIITLSGTPVLNRPIEIYNSIKLISPNLFPNKMYFAKRYCNAKHTGFGWDFNGSSNTEELNEILTESIMIRRKKKDVLKDLPPKIRSFIPMPLKNREVYTLAETDFISYVSEEVESKFEKDIGNVMETYDIDVDYSEIKQEAINKKVDSINILTKIEKLKQLAVEGKLDYCINWIKDFIESGEKLVIFTTHKNTITKLLTEFKSISVKIDGSTPAGQREQVVQRFQKDTKIKLFIGNIKAAGEAITLTAASNVLFLELPWSPTALDQAEDRCHRITQEMTVNVYYLLAENTIEYDIAELLDEKRKIVDAVIDGKITKEESLITQLIKRYK